MDYKALIEKYLAGETTLEEERLLKTYFAEEANVEVALKPYIPLFRFFREEKTRLLPHHVERNLEKQLSVSEAHRFRLKPVRWAVAAAITLATLGTATWIYQHEKTTPETADAAIDWSKYEPETPEKAYEITRMALLKVSNAMNRGTKMASERMEGEIRRIGEN